MKKQMKGKKNKLTSAGFLMLISVFVIGCAGTSKMSPFQTDEMLVRAGFQLQTADTPKKLHFIKSLPKNKLLHRVHKGKTFYFYVDDSCQCMYVGSEQAYQRLRKSVKKDQMDERIDTTSSDVQQEMENFPMDTNNPFDFEEHLP